MIFFSPALKEISPPSKWPHIFCAAQHTKTVWSLREACYILGPGNSLENTEDRSFSVRLLNLLSFIFCFVLFVLVWFFLLERCWCFSLQHPHSLQLPCNFQGDLELVVPQKWCQGSSQGAVHKLSAPIRTQDGAMTTGESPGVICLLGRDCV